MGVITELKPLFKAKKRISIYVDGELWGALNASLVREAKLQVGMELAERLWEALIQEEYQGAMDAALYYLEMRQRSVREMERYLRERLYDPRIAAQVMSRLMELRYLDDESLAQNMVTNLGQNLGKRAIAEKMRLRGLDRDVIEQAMEALDMQQQTDQAYELALSLWYRHRNEIPRKRREKTAAAMARRGFGWDDISSAISAVQEQEAEQGDGET